MERTGVFLKGLSHKAGFGENGLVEKASVGHEILD
jgi:hypothetical protein